MSIISDVENMVANAQFLLRNDIKKALKAAFLQETNKKAKQALQWIIANSAVARIERLALCQDTGMPIIFIEAGRDVYLSYNVVEEIKRGVEEGYKHHYLRPSLVDPVKPGSPSYCGAVTHITFSKDICGIKVTLLPKGFGSENKSRLAMFNPTVPLAEIEEFIVNTVREAGPEACPPFVVGVGIGGTSDYSLLLAKQALLQRIDKPQRDIQLATWENHLLKKINNLRIGPMGLGGKCTALAVKIKKAPTHIAGLPVGVNISCHALRSAEITIKQ